jgi:dTDP-4-dehydrorhamnose 3,5-epimerase
MHFDPLEVPGAFLATGQTFVDSRGEFTEWFKHDELEEITKQKFAVVQANTSVSNTGVLRGIHFSRAKQSKWVGCLSGAILDVIVDLRVGSPTFLKSIFTKMEPTNPQLLLVPAGVGHGFLSLENKSVVSYLLTSPYSPNDEFAIDAFDSDLNLDWPEADYLRSKKDEEASGLIDHFKGGTLPKF